MSDLIQEYFADEKNCYRDMGEVRKLYNTNTTIEQARNARKSLGLMYIWCPEDLKDFVLGCMNEFDYRMNYRFGVGWALE